MPEPMSTGAIIAMIGSALVSGLFGGSQEARRKKMLQEYLDMMKPEFEFWSQQGRSINPMILQALKTQMGRYQNWGWPGGGE